MRRILLNVALGYLAGATFVQYLNPDGLMAVSVPLAFLGALMNWVAVTANGGKMPVRGMFHAKASHRPMTRKSRLKWLCDIYTTPIGVASLGDFVLSVSLLFHLALGAAKVAKALL